MFQFTRLTLFDYWFCILRCFWRLSVEFLNHGLVISLSFKLHPSSLSLKSFNFNLIILKFELILFVAAWALVSVFLSIQKLFILSVFDINGQSFRCEESEPLKSWWVKSYLCEGILPVWDAQVHNHQSEIVRKWICNEKPVATQILEPNLWFWMTASEQNGQSSIFDIRVNIKGMYVLLLFDNGFVIAAVFVVICTDSGEPECLAFYFLYISELVEMHLA